MKYALIRSIKRTESLTKYTRAIVF